MLAIVVLNADGFDQAVKFTQEEIFADTLASVEVQGGRRLRLDPMSEWPDLRFGPSTEAQRQIFEEARDRCREASRSAVAIGSSL